MTAPMRVAVQGAPGCFSHAAGQELFSDLELVPCASFRELFEAVRSGRADRGMVPVENALAGAVVENLDLLGRMELPVVAETCLRIEMCLAARPGVLLSDLTAVGSHPVALRQCGDFLAQHPGIRPVVAHDTAGAIQELMAGGTEYDAAIGPALAVQLYGAVLLHRGVEDHRNNFTRFLVIAREEEDTTAEADKASLIFTLSHRPGALHGALGIFAAESLDLTRLESRPIPGRPWEYRFHADVRITGSGDFDRALAELRRMAPEVQLLGRYRAAEVPGP